MEVTTQPADSADYSQEKKTLTFMTQLSGKGQRSILITKISPWKGMKTIKDDK